MSTTNLLVFIACNTALVVASCFKSGLLRYNHGVDRGWIAIGALNLLAVAINLLNLVGRLAQ